MLCRKYGEEPATTASWACSRPSTVSFEPAFSGPLRLSTRLPNSRVTTSRTAGGPNPMPQPASVSAVTSGADRGAGPREGGPQRDSRFSTAPFRRVSRSSHATSASRSQAAAEARAPSRSR